MNIRDHIKDLKHNHPKLFKKSSLWGGAMVGHAWLMILAATATAVYFNNIIVSIIAIMLIGSRQLGLAILMHEAAHKTLFKNSKINDVIGSWFCSLPVIYDLKAYRSYHLTHHKNTQSSNDPDLHLSSKFPVTLLSMTRKILRDLTGITGLKLRFFQFRSMFRDSQKNAANTAIRFFQSIYKYLISQAIIFVVFLFLFNIQAYLIYWLIPLITWMQVVTRIRNISEHAMVSDNINPLLHARRTDVNLFERIFFAPYYVNYHLEHHLLVSVPFFRLKKLAKLLDQTFKNSQMEVQKGYLKVLKLAITSNSS
tara:strand:- start:10185 stop:11114 length:930 start_codon:yes stop_codon:yes gene_type:complete